MPYNLLREPWLPFRRRSGVIIWAPPAAIVSDMEEDPVVALATPRADFDGALQEFLIGLLSTALEVADETEWRALWEEPPSERDLGDAFAKLPPAFDLDGDGPRFMQDFSEADLAGCERSPVEQLLIDAPGDQTRRLNTDLFVKRGRVQRLSRSSAAMALLTLQTYAPSGGSGYRTSVRGGGPLTTLADPRVDREGEASSGAWPQWMMRWGRAPHADDQPLWAKLWANVETLEQLADRAPGSHRAYSSADIFPWLAPTRVSEKQSDGASVETAPADAHPFQAYFGMPRRVRLDFGGAGECDLTGRADSVTVAGCRQRNYGVNYMHWRHPLTPYYRSKGALLPLHGQPGDIGWRDWLALTLAAPADADRQPALVVARFAGRARALQLEHFRLHAFGYAMDNAKARGWTDALLPAIAPADADAERRVRALAEALTKAVDLIAAELQYRVRDALFAHPRERQVGSSDPRPELWSRTEAAFYDTIQSAGVRSAGAEASSAARADFRRVLEREALAIFDRRCSSDGASPQALRRIVRARYELGGTLRGYGNDGQKLFGVLELPRASQPVRKARKRLKTEATR